MAKGLNKCCFIGRLGKDIELMGNDDKSWCSFSLAIDESYKKDGEKVEKTEWINCNANGKLAEVMAEYLRKGDLIYVEGRVRTKKTDDKYYTNFQIDQLLMLGSKKDSGEDKPAPEKNNKKEKGGKDDEPF